MKNAELRLMLETEILRLGNSEKMLTDDEFNKYCGCLLRLCRLDCLCVLEQKRIYTATYGDLGCFVLEFMGYASPLLCRKGKKISASGVLRSRTDILFSPRLTEIALGCMLRSVESKNHSTEISFLKGKSHAVISVSGEKAQSFGCEFPYIKKIAELHGGRFICESCNKRSKIFLAIPVFPQFQPLKLIPCKAELCRLCRI